MQPEAIAAARARRRRAFADLIDSLGETELTTPSLCGRWDVRTVAAHLAFASNPSQGRFALALLRCGGSFDRANDRMARDRATRPTSELTATIRANAENPFAPPVVGPRAPLADAIIHDGDVRVPLGLPLDPDPDAVRCSLELVTSGRAIAFTRRGWLSNLRLVAEDVGFSSGPDHGAAVRGRGVDLLMAACGRRALLPTLSGDGVDILAGRLPT